MKSKTVKQKINTIIRAYRERPEHPLVQKMIESYWGKRGSFTIKTMGIFSHDLDDMVSWLEEAEFIESEIKGAALELLYNQAQSLVD